jgi:hypothetical protein
VDSNSLHSFEAPLKLSESLFGLFRRFLFYQFLQKDDEIEILRQERHQPPPVDAELEHLGREMEEIDAWRIRQSEKRK